MIQSLLSAHSDVPVNHGAAAAGGAAQPKRSFAELLRSALGGSEEPSSPALGTGVPVEAADGVTLKLSPQQQSALALATDQAAAQGASRALVMMDGLAIKVDVATRQVLGLASLEPSKPLTGFDAVITMPATTAQPAAASTHDAVLSAKRKLSSTFLPSR